MKDSRKTPQNEASSLPIKKPRLEKLPKEDKDKYSVYLSLDKEKDMELKLHIEFEKKAVFLPFEDGQLYFLTTGKLEDSGISTNILHFCYKEDKKDKEAKTSYSFKYKIEDQGSTPFFTIAIHEITMDGDTKDLTSLSAEELEEILNNRESKSTVYYGDADEDKKKKS